MTLKTNHVRVLLAVIALCGAGMLAAFLADDSLLARSELGGLSSVLAMVLGIGALAIPLLGLAGRLSDPTRIRSVIFLVVPLLTLAVFLDPRFDVFPVRILCLVGMILAFAGTVVVLFHAMGDKKTGARGAPSRFS